MGSSINIVQVNGLEWVGAVSEGGQPKSHITFLNKFLPQKASLGNIRLFVKRKMVKRCVRCVKGYITIGKERL